MRTIIAGSRIINDYDLVKIAIRDSGFTITKVISGCANGVDKLGEKWAKENGIEINQYPALWDQYGKSAGYHRNELMASNAEALILIWDSKSKGSANILKQSYKYKLKVYQCIID
ncbi:MAG TPA: SLOG family protein [Chitinophagales bacterium]|nr:SLOG family protein [Chitinophagales bacterium]HMW93451.1 SLOG family protein [Chitinophagales bacterium]HMZ92926.1 SLOG family protein [Chitinophagales bacterium]HNG25885.1 SLOG family protein [Chitinophagales bacterium]